MPQRAVRSEIAASSAASRSGSSLAQEWKGKDRPPFDRVVFYENPRGPEITATLPDACRTLNQRNLHRDGRLLRYAVEPPPTRGQFD